MAILDQATNGSFVSLMTSTTLFKVGTFFLAWAVLWLPLALPIAMVLKWRPNKPLAPDQKLPLLAALYLIAPLILWGASQLEGVPFSDYGLEWKLSVLGSLGLGLGVGILSLIIVFTGQLLLGWVRWNSENWQRLGPILLPVMLLGLWIGLTEELVFRGFLVNQLQQDYSIWVGAAISSGIFALLHLVWEQKDTIPQLPGLWLMGMVLVLARWVDGGSLGLAWGLHAGWIWGLTCLDSAELIAYTGIGPIWITGLGGKPLAGIVGLLCLLEVGALLLLMLPDQLINIR
ncbi:MAG: CPBP family intramembrane metalloprotease [Moorea sp. SIOASIH]|uniref:CPBP family intramembrane glutamic endopeptidase n=1 Tax=unclassified Moorena TaxID=2683338 RepID=UPI0013BA24CD|nr:MULTISPECIES: type II CAAX endopeptidase family protein [unclassified Moorena]NEO21469.1 CPBP family intramembrane metalloprotease [Moorena sp. SIO4A5]NEO39780.1 CPBP family intramembrane metalloprotease [Moorena sp. SIOASIH]NEQ56494.1 CPBP family intramembrane metalloprotease [Moorena sp. SIO4A1]